MAFSIREFLGITDQILYGWKNPLRLHGQVHFINEPVNMQTNRTLDGILNGNHTVIRHSIGRSQKNIGD
ncbi:hypothetical protein D3C87_2108880 [compost metagenome]